MSSAFALGLSSRIRSIMSPTSAPSISLNPTQLESLTSVLMTPPAPAIRCRAPPPARRTPPGPAGPPRPGNGGVERGQRLQRRLSPSGPLRHPLLDQRPVAVDLERQLDEFLGPAG